MLPLFFIAAEFTTLELVAGITALLGAVKLGLESIAPAQDISDKRKTDTRVSDPTP